MEWGMSDLTAIVLSIKVALTATLLALPLGFAAAYVLVFIPFRGKLVFELLINLPLTLPPVVVGYLLLVALGAHSYLGSIMHALGLKLLFTWRAAVMASMVVGFPLLVRSIKLSMESLDQHMLQSARTLGAHPWDVVVNVVWPLSLRGVLAGSSLMFARSLGEFGATVIVAGNIPGVTQTLPLAIYDYACTPQGENPALLLCGVSLLLSVAILAGNDWLTRKWLPRR